MKPVNNKSLLSFVFGQMEKLDEKLISVEEANAQANLTKQATSILRYELERAKVQIQLDVHDKNFSKMRSIREVESINFED